MFKLRLLFISLAPGGCGSVGGSLPASVLGSGVASGLCQAVGPTEPWSGSLEGHKKGSPSKGDTSEFVASLPCTFFRVQVMFSRIKKIPNFTNVSQSKENLVKFALFEIATKYDKISILLLTNKFVFFVSRYSFEHHSGSQSWNFINWDQPNLSKVIFF